MQAIVVILCLIPLTAWSLLWTVRRILLPVDRAAKDRNAPMRFSLGDFLCLFWVIQLPLAFVFRIEGEVTLDYYWAFTIVIWVVAPLVWFTVARVLSKAGVSSGIHRVVFLAFVVPTVYYGLFPFIGLSWAGVIGVANDGGGYLDRHAGLTLLWIVLFVALVACGYYSPWMVERTRPVPSNDA